MQLRGSWLDKMITLSGRYDKDVRLPSYGAYNKDVLLPSRCDAFSIRIKAALSSSIALCGTVFSKLYSYLRSTNTKVVVQVSPVSALAQKAVRADGDVTVLSTVSAYTNKGLNASGAIHLSPLLPLAPATGLCVLGDTSLVLSSAAHASQVRPRTLRDLDGVALSGLSDWALRDFYYVEV